MDTTSNPISATTKTVKKAVSWKNIVITALVMVAFYLIMSYVMRMDVVMYDEQGNIIQRGEMKPTFRKFKKQTAAETE